MTATPLTSARRRLSVPLSAQDIADLETIRNSPEQLRSLGDGLSKQSSESAIVHALLEKGLEAVKEQSVIEAYAQMAVDAAEIRESLANRERLTRRNRDVSTD